MYLFVIAFVFYKQDANIGSIMLKCKKIFYNPLIIPLLMGSEQLEVYKKYCKPLNENDLAKANNLIQKGCYVNVLQYMLRYNCKLEQEIVSLHGNRSL